MTKFCCEDIEKYVEYECTTHKNIFDCYDHLFIYNKIYDEYGVIIHDGGSSYIAINYCPFCGAKLPDSKREAYFDLLEQKGIWNGKDTKEEIPEEFKTDEWWKKRRL